MSQQRAYRPLEGRSAAAGRRGLVLPVILVLIGFLIVTMGSFIFFIRAETRGTIAHNNAHQLRLTAESGLEELTAVLRERKHDVTAWYDVPERFRHALVWSQDFDRESDPLREANDRREYLRERPALGETWRYSIVAPNFDGPEGAMRFGVTPESSKLNINAASEEQIRALATPILNGLGVENAPELIDALLDWLDADDEPREAGAESDYYNLQTPPYNAKNGPLDTVGEILLIKGWSAALLWGEDTNRNGILDPNEDDGDASFPYYDNADGLLNPGLAPFITVFSREPDTSLDNKPRINLNQDAGQIQQQVDDFIAAAEEDPDVEVELLSDETRQWLIGAKSQVDFRQLSSLAELYAGVYSDEDAAAAGNEIENENSNAENAEGEEAEDNGAGEASENEDGDGAPEDDDGPTGPGTGPPASPMLLQSPVTPEELPILFDRFSVRQNPNAPIIGAINVNTAPVRVLTLLPGLTAEQAQLIVATRQTLPAEQLKTPAWLLTAEVLDGPTFRQIAPFITTKAYQFHVEVVGYADHTRAARRFEWIIEMVGPLAQIKYHRELTKLGFAWPVDDERVITTTQ